VSVSPASTEELAAAIKEASRGGQSVRFSGGHTKWGWGAPASEPDLELSTLALDQIVEHNEGDLTAVLDAGVTLAALADTVGGANQMLALDPPWGDDDAATVGGAIATADSGPLRHRYGSVRDLVLGMTVVLSDGTVSKSGGKVIKNVAGYDLAKLFAGSYGSLGAVLRVAVRLHPLAPATATAVGHSDDPLSLADAASALSHAQLELQSLDVRWEDGHGTVLGRFGGATASDPAAEVAELLEQRGLETEVEADDTPLWDAQRAAQRSPGGIVVRVSGVQDQTGALLLFAQEHGARVVGRAALGLSWVTLPEPGLLKALRTLLAPSPCVVLDAPAAVRGDLDAWGPLDPGSTALMERVRERFDPTRTCAPGILAGGI